MPRWAIWIDIEGFGKLYADEARALKVFGCLMQGVYRVGSRGFPTAPDRLFAHHIGDGFVVLSDFGCATLDRPICIAIALLRHVASTGWFCKAAIGEGEFADIRGCYSDEIRLAAGSDGHRVSMGEGLLTTLPVMGSALIHAHEVSRKAKGALLLVASSERRRLPSCRIGEPQDTSVLAIDWIHSEPEGVRGLQQRAALEAPSESTVAAAISSYCASQEVPADWAFNTKCLLGIPNETSVSHERSWKRTLPIL